MLKFKRILVPVDFSTESHLALEWAVRLGQQQGDEVAIYLLHVVPFAPVMPEDGLWPDVSTAQIDDGLERLRDWQSRIPPPLSSVPICALGNPIDEIKRLCALESIDLVVMTTHARQGLSRALRPNLTEKVIRVAPCPVLVLHLAAGIPTQTFSARLQRILVPVDFTDDARLALDWAVRMLRQEETGAIYLLHVLSRSAFMDYSVGWNGGFLRTEWEEEKHAIENWQERIPPPIHSEVLLDAGAVPAAVRRACEKNSIDAVVMAVHEHRGLSALLRPDTGGRIVRLAPCPALVLHLNQHTRHLVSAPSV